MPTRTETLQAQCRALVPGQAGTFSEDLVAALRALSGRPDGMLSELLAAYNGLEKLLQDGLPATAAPPVNTALPTITGIAGLGELLSVSAGSWTGSPAPTISFQWLRNGGVIAGATLSSYLTAFPADNGASITCRVTASNASGTAQVLTANTIALPTWTAPVNTAVPSLTRTAGTLAIAASVGLWTGSPAPTFSYQWFRNGVAIPGATAPTFTAALTADSGASITCQVTASNAAGSAAATSAATVLPAWGPPTVVTAPQATLTAGTSQLAVTSNWTAGAAVLSGSPLTVVNAAAIGGAAMGLVTGQSYSFSVNFTKTSGSGLATIRVSTGPTAATEGGNQQAFSGDRGVGARTFSGTITATGPAFVIAAHDAVFTGSIDSVTLTPIPSLTYQWRRNSSPVSGATNPTYTIPDADSSTVWDVQVTAGTGGLTATAQATSPAIFVGIVDRLATAPAAVVGLRRVAAAYTGPLLRLRRSVDGAEADILAAVAGQLDTAAVLAHMYSGATALLGDTTGYGTGGSTVTANTPSAGFLRIVEDTSNGVHRIQKSLAGTLAAGAPVRFAAVVQRTAGTGRDVALELFSGSISLLVAFRLDTATTQVLTSTGATAVTATVQNLTSFGWLCEVTFTPSAALTNPLALVSLLPAGGSGDNRPYLGNGVSALTLSAPALYTNFPAELGGTVATLYDQIATAHLTPAAAANAPILVESGALVQEGGGPTLRFAGAQDLVATVSVDATALSTVCTFTNTYASPNACISAGNPDRVALYRLGESNIRCGPASTTGGMADYSGTVAANVPRVYYAAGGAFAVFADENNTAMTKIVDTALGSFSNVFCLGSRRVGGASPLYLTGNIREALLFPTDVSAADRARLARNQGNFYNITVA